MKYTLHEQPRITATGKMIIEHEIWEKINKDDNFTFLKTGGHTTPSTVKKVKKIVDFLNTNGKRK